MKIQKTLFSDKDNTQCPSGNSIKLNKMREVERVTKGM